MNFRIFTFIIVTIPFFNMHAINPATNSTCLCQQLTLKAIKNGDLESALLLIKKGNSFSEKIDGVDAFTYVSKNFNMFTPGQSKQIHLDLMYEIIKQGYNLQDNFNNKDLLNNAWYLAIKNNQVNHILFFLNQYPGYSMPYNANPNQIFVLPDGSTWTPTLIAIKSMKEQEELELSQLKLGSLGSLLRYGNVDLNQKTKPDGKILQSPLSYVLKLNPHFDCMPIEYTIDSLMKKGANLAEAIDIFIKNGGSKDHTIKSLRYIDGGKYLEYTLLGLAVAYNDVNAVKILLSAGASVNQLTDPFIYVETTIKGQHTPLFYALQHGYRKIIEVLLKNGASEEPLAFSSITANNNMVTVQEMLYQAILNDSKEEIIRAIQAGANINAAKNKINFITLAIIFQKYNALEELLKHNITIDEKTVSFALLKPSGGVNDIRAATLLAVRSGILIDAVLNYAIQGSSSNIKEIIYLLDNGANPNQKINNRQTLLQDAVYNKKNPALIKALIEHGAIL